MSHFLFIDDSGSKEWDHPYNDQFRVSPPARTDANRQYWEKNYFVLAGVYLPSGLVAELNPYINALKVEYFGTKHVEIRSVWLRNPGKRKVQYLDKFGITEERLKEFVEAKWFRLMQDNAQTLQLQAFVLDKRLIKNTRSKMTPLERTSLVLFDRVELNPNKACQIVFDQMDDQIKSERHQQGKILKIARREVDLGSFHGGKKYSHASVSFEKSSNSNFLQLADTVAYTVLRQFVDHGDDWEKPAGTKLKMYPYLKRLGNNFYCEEDTGKVSGYGVVKIPSGRLPHGWSKPKKTA